MARYLKQRITCRMLNEPAAVGKLTCSYCTYAVWNLPDRKPPISCLTGGQHKQARGVPRCITEPHSGAPNSAVLHGANLQPPAARRTVGQRAVALSQIDWLRAPRRRHPVRRAPTTLRRTLRTISCDLCDLWDARRGDPPGSPTARERCSRPRPTGAAALRCASVAPSIRSSHPRLRPNSSRCRSRPRRSAYRSPWRPSSGSRA